VVCFGVPWYAGWGVTDDRQPQHAAMLRRAGRSRSVDELFAAGYMHYTRYLNPETRQRAPSQM
jgi:capsular polysaccharide export protein